MQKEYLTLAFASDEVRVPSLSSVSLLIFVFVSEDFDQFPVSIIHDEVFDGIAVGLESRHVVDVQDLYGRGHDISMTAIVEEQLLTPVSSLEDEAHNCPREKHEVFGRQFLFLILEINVVVGTPLWQFRHCSVLNTR